MGFFWAKPETSLQKSLLEEEPELILRAGDLLFIAASELEITMDVDCWIHVAIVVHHNKKVYAFMNGALENVYSFITRHQLVVCRALQCIRPMGFDSKVYDAYERTTAMLKKRKQIKMKYQEGFCIGSMLGILDLVDLKQIAPGKLKPCHFAIESTRLDLKEYSTEHWSINF
jgi:hypothetical protein